jgi:hypothetical protein
MIFFNPSASSFYYYLKVFWFESMIYRLQGFVMNWKNVLEAPSFEVVCVKRSAL